MPTIGQLNHQNYFRPRKYGVQQAYATLAPGALPHPCAIAIRQIPRTPRRQTQHIVAEGSNTQEAVVKGERMPCKDYNEAK